jgi:histidyl-tRNA synthetase
LSLKAIASRTLADGVIGQGFELLEKLESDTELNTIASAKAGLKDMRLLFEYLQVYEVLDKVRQLVCAQGVD